MAIFLNGIAWVGYKMGLVATLVLQQRVWTTRLVTVDAVMLGQPIFCYNRFVMRWVCLLATEYILYSAQQTSRAWRWSNTWQLSMQFFTLRPYNFLPRQSTMHFVSLVGNIVLATSFQDWRLQSEAMCNKCVIHMQVLKKVINLDGRSEYFPKK